MTDEVAALSVLIQNDLVSTEIDSFYERWADDRLVIDKWFMLQTSLSQPSKSLEITKTLTKHSDFNKKIQIDFEPPLVDLLKTWLLSIEQMGQVISF